MRTARFAPLGFIPAIAIVLVVLGDRLPEPMATHWSGRGEPNGHQTQLSFGLLMSGIWLFVWAVVILVRRRYQLGHWNEPVSPKAQLIGGYALLGMMISVFASVVVANLDVPTWRHTKIDSAVLWLFGLGAGVGAYVGSRLARRLLKP